jgi:peptidoglycan/LPS O-acetylase OafA/YrhL
MARALAVVAATGVEVANLPKSYKGESVVIGGGSRWLDFARPITNQAARMSTGATAAPVPVRAPAHVPAVDGFRGIAALLVLIFHCWTMTDPPLDSGPVRALAASAGLGVDFFFVISGFVLFLPVVVRGGRFGSIRSYALRRAARIAPAYYLALLVQAAARPLLLPTWPSPFVSIGGIAAIVVHLLFLQHESPRWLFRQLGYGGGVMGLGVNGALWSLSIEILFYAALPLVAGLYFRRPRLGLVTAVVATFVWRAAAYRLGPVSDAIGLAATTGQVPRLVEQFPGYLAHFAFGMTGAFIYASGGRREGASEAMSERVARVAVLVLLLLAMGIRGESARGPGMGFYTRYVGDVLPAFLFAALVTLTTIAPARAQMPYSHPFCRWLGDVSYGVFLWHFPLILFFANTLGWTDSTGNAAFAGTLALVVPSSLFLGWLSRRFVEEPAIAWARRRTHASAETGR